MVDKVVGRVMLTIGLMIFLALFTYQASARTVSVFDIRQNIPLTDDEPVYRDYYINGGTDVGIEKGMKIAVERRVSLHDSFQNQSPGSLVVETGMVQVIHVQENVSVARLVSLPTNENRPVLATGTVMVGDTLKVSQQLLREAPKRMENPPEKKMVPKKLQPEKAFQPLPAAPEKQNLAPEKYLQTRVVPVTVGAPVLAR